LSAIWATQLSQEPDSIAERLALNTDQRSGLGLLFLIVGKEGKEHKIVLSRFPTDSAIYVDENPTALTVEFLERVLMKNKTSYKPWSIDTPSERWILVWSRN
jgi:hypothetical protein